jgi:signal transduction histidine kinase
VRDALIATQSRAGCLLFLRCNASPLVGPDGAITGAIVLVQDVTGERAAHERQAELRDRLLETVNHHLRTPVTKLLGYAEVLADNGDALPPETRRAVAAILGAAEELGTLLETVSGLSDLDRHTDLTKTYGDLSIALGQVARTLRPVFDTRDVRLEVDVPDRLLVVLDFAEVRSAIGALLANAARYAPSGSVVRLGARADETLGIEITVSDLGPGIDEADRDRLVRPFERGAHPDQDVTGKGMGLAVAHTVAGAHGGALRLESNVPQGLRATLLIPSPSFG